MVKARHIHGNGQGEMSPQALTENPNGVQSFSPGLPREAAATLGGTSQNPTANSEAARSAKLICGFPINPISLIRPILPHFKSTVDLGCEPLIKVENGLRQASYKPTIRPENRESNRIQTVTDRKFSSPGRCLWWP